MYKITQKSNRYWHETRHTRWHKNGAILSHCKYSENSMTFKHTDLVNEYNRHKPLMALSAWLHLNFFIVTVTDRDDSYDNVTDCCHQPLSGVNSRKLSNNIQHCTVQQVVHLSVMLHVCTGNNNNIVYHFITAKPVFFAHPLFHKFHNVDDVTKTTCHKYRNLMLF